MAWCVIKEIVHGVSPIRQIYCTILGRLDEPGILEQISPAYNAYNYKGGHMAAEVGVRITSS